MGSLSKILVALTITTLSLSGRISSYKPGVDGTGTRLAGSRCLNLPEKYWDHPIGIPVCAMRAGCSTGSIRMGDVALVKRKGWNHWCVVLDSGPWGCLDTNGKWNNCGPKTKHKGILPKGWAWKSVIDIAAPGPGYPGGGPGKVTVLHWQAKKKARREIVLGLMK